MQPQTTKKATTILRSRKLSAIYALLVVYTAALCGWDLNDHHEPINILNDSVALTCLVALVYLFQRERGGKQ